MKKNLIIIKKNFVFYLKTFHGGYLKIKTFNFFLLVL